MEATELTKIGRSVSHPKNYQVQNVHFTGFQNAICCTEFYLEKRELGAAEGGGKWYKKSITGRRPNSKALKVLRGKAVEM